MLTILCLSLSPFTPQSSDWPPPPNFETKVDYLQWWQDCVRGDFRSEENGYELYKTIFPSPDHHESGQLGDLGFAGFRHAKPEGHFVGPWNPAEHADWERSYQDTKKVLGVFRRAARRPYALFPVQYEGGGDAPKVLSQHLVPHLPLFRRCARGLSEASWRAEKNRVSSVRLLTNCRTILQAAGQVEREPHLISYLVAIAIRAVAYDDLRHALHHEVFSERQLAAGIRMLETVDAPTAPYERALRGEYAGVCDFLQWAADRKTPVFGDETTRDLVRSMRDGRIDVRRTPKAWGEYMHKLADLAELPFTPDKQRAITRLEEKYARVNTVMNLFAPSLGRPFLLAARVEAERRATRLLLAVHIYKLKRGHWPKSLNDLRDSVGRAMTVDPFGGKPFAYRLAGNTPLLYSTGIDCDDDGGKHHDRWGERNDADPDGDYVFWPIQK